jgi:hypothetical protein
MVEQHARSNEPILGKQRNLQALVDRRIEFYKNLGKGGYAELGDRGKVRPNGLTSPGPFGAVTKKGSLLTSPTRDAIGAILLRKRRIYNGIAFYHYTRNIPETHLLLMVFNIRLMAYYLWLMGDCPFFVYVSAPCPCKAIFTWPVVRFVVLYYNGSK